MPRAFVHIGDGKCGSSLIQGLLNELDTRSIVPQKCEPLISRMIQTHTPCFQYDDPFYQQILDGIRSEIPACDVFLSAENLFGAMSHRENCYDESAKAIERLFDGFEIKLFLLLRRQDTFMESMYNQDVKRGELRTFDEYIGESMPDNLHWDKVADAYSRFDLTVRPFEKWVLTTGGLRDFTDALFRWLGVEVVIDNLPIINPSLSLGGLEVQRTANRVLETKAAYDLSGWLERHCPKRPEDKHGLFGDRESFIDRYKKSNRRLFENFLPGFDPSYYLGG